MIKSASFRETEKIGKELAAELKPSITEATVLELHGPLGSGKTTFVNGIYKAFGLKRAQSPTFIIIRRFKIKRPRMLASGAKIFKNIFHMDLYRTNNHLALKSLELPKLFKDPSNLILIEWAGILPRGLYKKSIKVRFRYGENPNERSVTIRR